MKNEQKFLKALAGIYTFYDRELTEGAIEIWKTALDGYNVEAIDDAFMAHIKDAAGKFLPKPADIIRQLEGTDDEAALMAWVEVIGSYRALNEAAQKAVEAMGGFVAIRRAPEAENHFLQRRFVEFFKAYRNREKIEKTHAVMLANESVKRLK